MQIPTPKSRKKLYTIVAVALVFVLVCTLAFFILQKRDSDQRKIQYGSEKTNPSTDVPSGNSDSSTPPNNSSIGSTKDSTNDQTSTPSPSPSQQPVAPTGTFVSNHRPNLSGSPAPNSINSTCTTTPGATCMITLTSENKTRSLPAKNADINGNTSWDWKLQDIGISEGVWTVKAIAQNGSLTAESVDPTKLEVKP